MKKSECTDLIDKSVFEGCFELMQLVREGSSHRPRLGRISLEHSIIIHERIRMQVNFFILEWTTSLDSSSGTLICPSLCPRHVGRNNYVPLFGVDPIEWRLTRYYVICDVIVMPGGHYQLTTLYNSTQLSLVFSW